MGQMCGWSKNISVKHAALTLWWRGGRRRRLRSGSRSAKSRQWVFAIVELLDPFFRKDSLLAAMEHVQATDNDPVGNEPTNESADNDTASHARDVPSRRVLIQPAVPPSTTTEPGSIPDADALGDAVSAARAMAVAALWLRLLHRWKLRCRHRHQSTRLSPNPTGV